MWPNPKLYNHTCIIEQHESHWFTYDDEGKVKIVTNKK